MNFGLILIGYILLGMMAELGFRIAIVYYARKHQCKFRYSIKADSALGIWGGILHNLTLWWLWPVTAVVFYPDIWNRVKEDCEEL